MLIHCDKTTETQERLDGLVFEWSKRGAALSESELILLLFNIVNNSDGLLDKRFAGHEGQHLFHENADLRKALRYAWRSEIFEKIWRLSMSDVWW